MRLTGSKTEQEIRDQLIISKQVLFNGQERRRLLELLKNKYPKMRTAYIVHWIPEQGEDIYDVLVDDNIIAKIELDRHNDKVEPIVESKSILQYVQGLSKLNQIKIAIALDLAKKDLGVK